MIADGEIAPAGSDLLHYAAVIKTGTKGRHVAPRNEDARLAQVERLSYHPGAIMGDDREANQRRQNSLRAGQHHKLMKMSAGAQAGGEFRRRNAN
jgi:hypothetical protein